MQGNSMTREEALEMAAGLWTMPQRSGQEMDSQMAEDIADLLLKIAPKRPVIIEATLPLESGLAVLQIPDRLSKESFGDLDDWINLVLRKAKRSINQPLTPRS